MFGLEALVHKGEKRRILKTAPRECDRREALLPGDARGQENHGAGEAPVEAGGDGAGGGAPPAMATGLRCPARRNPA